MKIIVGNNEYTHFSSYKINLKLDAIASTFSFTGLKDFVEDYLTYKNICIYRDNGELLITGTVLSPDLLASTKPELIQLNGYSKPGVLEDVDIPTELYPLQFDRLTLREVATQILGWFDIDFVVDPVVQSAMDKTFEKINENPGTSPKQMINKLASQRNIILSHDKEGRVVFTRLQPDKQVPVASIKDGDTGLKQMRLSIDAKSMHSSITAVREASRDNPDAAEATVVNPYLRNIKRPAVKTMRSGDIFDVGTAARNILVQELTNIELIVDTTKFVRPGELIEVQSDMLKIKRPRLFFVRSVDIEGVATGDVEKYKWICVPKDVYTDVEPENVFE